jgi:hypothetical protein
MTVSIQAGIRPIGGEIVANGGKIGALGGGRGAFAGYSIGNSG